MRVYCYPASRDSAYVPLLFAGIAARYHPVYRQDGTIRTAIAELASGHPAIVHIHWEEFVLRDCRTVAEADAAAAEFVADIDDFVAGGGILCWTIHNELPHVIPFHEQFLAMRRRLAARAALILVHNTASRDVLAGQCELDHSKLRLLPHPSYLDRFEDAATLPARIAEAYAPRLQCFGWLRLQKGFAAMLDQLPPAFLAARGLTLRISGHGEEAAAVIAQRPGRTDVGWDVRHVPDAETPALLRGAACVILPYERVLTSGVALLAISVGAMIVAVDIPQLRELLPATAHRFLYPRDDGAALRSAIDAVLALAPAERHAVLLANLAAAQTLHPRLIAARLADLYDAARARP